MRLFEAARTLVEMAELESQIGILRHGLESFEVMMLRIAEVACLLEHVTGLNMQRRAVRPHRNGLSVERGRIAISSPRSRCGSPLLE
jgi:hypothetical protein